MLVGTTSIEKSEKLSELLKDRKYIRELGQYLKKQADGLKEGKEDELKEQLHGGRRLPRRALAARTAAIPSRTRC